MKKIIHFIAHSRVASIVAALFLVCACLLNIDGAGLLSSMDDGQGRVAYLPMIGALFLAYASVKAIVEYSLSGSRTPLSGTLFLMGCAVAPSVVCSSSGFVSSLLLALACYILLRTYRDPLSMGSYFAAFVLVGIATFVTPSLLWGGLLLLPCCIPLHSLRGRTVMAALLGLLACYWVAFGLLYLTDNMALLSRFLDSLVFTPPTFSIAVFGSADFLSRSLPMLWVLMLLIPGTATILSDTTLNLRSRSCYYFFIAIAGILLLVLLVIPALYDSLLPLLLLLVAYVGMPLFAGAVSRSKSIYLILLLIVWALLFTRSLWMPFLPF